MSKRLLLCFLLTPLGLYAQLEERLALRLEGGPFTKTRYFYAYDQLHFKLKDDNIIGHKPITRFFPKQRKLNLAKEPYSIDDFKVIYTYHPQFKSMMYSAGLLGTLFLVGSFVFDNPDAIYMAAGTYTIGLIGLERKRRRHRIGRFKSLTIVNR